MSEDTESRFHFIQRMKWSMFNGFWSLVKFLLSYRLRLLSEYILKWSYRLDYKHHRWPRLWQRVHPKKIRTPNYTVDVEFFPMGREDGVMSGNLKQQYNAKWRKHSTKLLRWFGGCCEGGLWRNGN